MLLLVFFTLYLLYFGVLKISHYSPAGGYLGYFKFAHLSTQQSKDSEQDIYLKDVILRERKNSRG